MSDLTPWQWVLAAIAAMGIGISKSGFPGVGLFHVVVYAHLFGGKTSTGIILPMLVVGDISAIIAFRQHARWDYIGKMLPPAAIGIILGWQLMQVLNESWFNPLIGCIILGLILLQVGRTWRPSWFLNVPHKWWFAWGLGLFAGMTTMLANAAGPIMALYLLAVALPKFEFVGTSAWFFFIVNVFKIPFSAKLGLIHQSTLTLNLIMVPVILVGFLFGRWLIKKVPQRLFDTLLLLFAAVAALRLIGAW